MAAPAAMPWSLKGVSLEARLAAKQEARAAGIPIGEWLNAAIRAAAAAEGTTAPGPAKAGESLIERAVALQDPMLAATPVGPARTKA